MSIVGSKLKKRMLELMSGKASKMMHGIYFGTILSGYVIISLIAQSLFPVDYSILDFKISAQGGITSNPEGHLLWNIGMIVMGILLIPHMLYLYENLKVSSPQFAQVVRLISISACVGFSFVGVFPREYPLPHSIPAAIALYGLFISLNLNLLLLIDRKKNFNSNWPRSWGFVGIFIPMNIIVLSNIARSMIPQELWNAQIDPRYYAYPVWQWSMFMSFFFTMLTLYSIIPPSRVTK